MIISEKVRSGFRILIYCPYAFGGLADYAQAQARALSLLPEVKVMWLAPGKLAAPVGVARVGEISTHTHNGGKQRRGILKKVIGYIRNEIGPVKRLDSVLNHEPVDAVLCASYAEYLAPFWAWRLRRWRKRGVRFGAIVHDPVRDHQVGPKWWHRWSIASGYSFLDVAFVHEAIQLDTVRSFPRLKTVTIPHGLLTFEGKSYEKAEACRQLGIPPDKPVLLSFGHIRDGKNLDLILQVMSQFPDVWLVVAGKEQSSGQRQAGYYRQLASDLGVADRVCWHVRHIPESEVGLFFGAADFLMLTYSRDFRSASGVLAAAVHYQKPVLASSGVGPLQRDVQDFGLGEWIEPDSLPALTAGLGRLLSVRPTPDWARYRETHSWELNARLVMENLAPGLGTRN